MTAPAPLSGGDARTQRAEVLRDEIAGWPIGSGYYQSKIAVDEAAEIADFLLPVVERIADERAAEAWDAGYSAAELDADEIPYSDRPERATWQPRQNPHRAASLRAASRGGAGL